MKKFVFTFIFLFISINVAVSYNYDEIHRRYALPNKKICFYIKNQCKKLEKGELFYLLYRKDNKFFIQTQNDLKGYIKAKFLLNIEIVNDKSIIEFLRKYVLSKGDKIFEIGFKQISFSNKKYYNIFYKEKDKYSYSSSNIVFKKEKEKISILTRSGCNKCQTYICDLNNDNNIEIIIKPYSEYIKVYSTNNKKNIFALNIRSLTKRNEDGYFEINEVIPQKEYIIKAVIKNKKGKKVRVITYYWNGNTFVSKD